MGLDLVQSNDNTLPESMHTRLLARPTGNLYWSTPDGQEHQVGPREVFVGGAAPTVTTQAIYFEPITVDGQTVYRLKVNDGIS